ncbi:hypothetical protein B0T20DRAFT_364423 [Sordaria brevicollis]|uniref:Uncharacterized protein n=1 Tax=Sordaria brevicollis TaxID=83679 RepID=A0AAE0NW07_SORBR|nr:hypothetical protein B0T20DRAFT_364423 [Sordaria brevicollis]
MARIKFTSRKTAAPEAEAELPGAGADENQTMRTASSEAGNSNTESTLLLPEPKSRAKANPTKTGAAAKNAQTEPKTIKKIILHLPPARVQTQMDILPVDTIMSDMVDANGGVSPSVGEIEAEAINWFKHAYRTGTRVEVVKAAAQAIIGRLDSVISGNPGYMHNQPHGQAYERLELQRMFLRVILRAECGALTSLALFSFVLLVQIP